MEDSGLVSSRRDTSKNGSARRVYDLTDTGPMFLNNWMVMADMHRNFLKSMLEFNPLMSAMSAASGSRSSAEDNSDTESESDGKGDEGGEAK